MRPKSALRLLSPLLSSPLFTSIDAAGVGVSVSTLAYYVKAGDLERVSRGIYRSTHAPSLAEFRWEDLILAVQASRNGVVCLTSALAYYELTEEMPRQHWIAVRNTTRHRACPSTKVIRTRNVELGKKLIQISGLDIPIFDQERTLVDAFRYLSVETAIKALRTALSQKGRKRLDLTKLRRYAKVLRVQIEPYLLAVTV